MRISHDKDNYYLYLFHIHQINGAHFLVFFNENIHIESFNGQIRSLVHGNMNIEC